MKKLPARYLPLATPFVLSGIMSLLVTGVATLKGFGPVSNFAKLWMGAWAVSWPVAFPDRSSCPAPGAPDRCNLCRDATLAKYGNAWHVMLQCHLAMSWKSG